MTPTVAALIGAQARAMVRDRTAVVFLVALPVAIMAVLGNVYAAEDNGPLPLALHAEEPGPVSMLLRGRLDATGTVRIVEVGSVAELDELVRRGEVDAGLVVPAAVESAGAPATGRATVELVGAPDVAAPIGVRRVVEAVVAEVGAAADLAARADGLSLDAAARELAPDRPRVELSADGARRRAAIATLVLVTFMNLIAIGALVPGHRSLGVLQRIAVAPVGRRALVGGYLAVFAFVGAVQVAVALLAGRVLLGIEWGPTAAVALLGGGLALAAGAAGVLAGTLLPTPESGSAVGGPVGFLLGMVGGCLWPLDIVSRPLQVLGRFTPHAWVVDGFAAAGNGSLGSVELTRTLGVLVVTVVGLAALGTARLARSWR